MRSIALLTLLAVAACEPAHQPAQYVPAVIQPTPVKTADYVRSILTKEGRDKFVRDSTSFEWIDQAIQYAADTTCVDVPLKQKPKCMADDMKRIKAMLAEQERIEKESAARDAERYRRNAQADYVCTYKQRMTQASYPDRSLLGLDALVAGAGAKNACMDLYRQTGIIPQP